MNAGGRIGGLPGGGPGGGRTPGGAMPGRRGGAYSDGKALKQDCIISTFKVLTSG